MGKKGKKTLLSFADDDDDGDPIVTIDKKKKKNAALPLAGPSATSTSTSYSIDALKALKLEQLAPKPPPTDPELSMHDLDDALLPASTAEAVQKAKKTRLELRDQALSQQTELDFIRISQDLDDPMQLDSTPPSLPDAACRPVEEALVEAYDDNNGATISFGAASILSAQTRQRQEFRDRLVQAQAEDLDDDDPEMNDWEDELVKHGVKPGSDITDLLKKSRRAKLSARDARPKVVKVPVPVPDIKDMLSSIDSRITQLDRDIIDHESHLASITYESEKNTADAVVARQEKAVLSEKYEFFAEFEAFLLDFSGFMDEKIPVIDRVEDSLMGLYEVYASGAIDAQLYFMQKYEKMEPLREEFFSDVYPSFHSLDHILVRYFAPWHASHNETWEAAYVGLSVADCAEVYVRLQICGWNPFDLDEPADPIESMPWHLDLVDTGFCDMDVLKRVVERFVLPYLVRLVKTERVIDVTRPGMDGRLVGLVNDLKGYLDQSELERAFLPEIEKQAWAQVSRLVDKPLPSKFVFPASVAYPRYIQRAEAAYYNLLTCRRVLPAARVREVCMDQLMARVLVPCIAMLEHIPSILELMDPLVKAIPAEWMDEHGDAGTCPPFCEQIRGFLVDLHKRPGSEEFAGQIARLLVHIKALNDASMIDH